MTTMTDLETEARSKEGINGYASAARETDIGRIVCRRVPAFGVSTKRGLHFTFRWLLNGRPISRASLAAKLNV